jgi:hypothetical protein
VKCATLIIVYTCANRLVYQTLIKLAHSSDEEIAAIACFDIGEFVRHYPNGKHIARRLGARDVVMGLIEHDDMEVQRQALLCISKMLVKNWQVSSLEWCCQFGWGRGSTSMFLFLQAIG